MTRDELSALLKAIAPPIKELVIETAKAEAAAAVQPLTKQIVELAQLRTANLELELRVKALEQQLSLELRVKALEQGQSPRRFA